MRRWLCALWAMVLTVTCFVWAAAAEKRTVRVDEYTERIEYVDDQGNRIAGPDGHSFVMQTRDNAGRVILKGYFDTEGKPYYLKGGYCANSWIYSEDGYVEVAYLDREGNPVKNTSGYAIVRRKMDEQNRIAWEMYYDTQRKPAQLWGKQYGERRDAYDANGKCIQVTYLDIHGEPMALASGYSTIRRSYNAEGKIEVSMYLDLEGNPVQVPLGQYGERNVYDQAGNKIAIIYLDAEGKPTATRDGYTILKREYAGGKVVAERYFDGEDQPMQISRRRHGVRILYDGDEETARIPFDLQGKDIFLLDQYLLRHPGVVLLGALAVILAGRLFPKKMGWILLAVYVHFILYMTLYVREPGGDMPPRLELLSSYKEALTSAGSREHIINNILLFVPFGFLLRRVLSRWWTVLVPVILSAAIEGIQLAAGLGYCDVDDVVSNGLGGVLGCLLALLLTAILRKRNTMTE